MKKIVFLLLILTTLIVLIIPSPAYACSCLRTPPLESLETSAAVFSGRVIDIEGIPLPGPGVFSTFMPVKVTIQVSKVWKGPSDETLVIRTALEGASCGLGRTFMIGEEYLVYAYASGDGSELRAGLCSRTAQISNAQEDLAVLNRLGGRPPEVSDSTPQFDFAAILRNNYYLILGAVGVAIAVLLISRRSGR